MATGLDFSNLPFVDEEEEDVFSFDKLPVIDEEPIVEPVVEEPPPEEPTNQDVISKLDEVVTPEVIDLRKPPEVISGTRGAGASRSFEKLGGPGASRSFDPPDDLDNTISLLLQSQEDQRNEDLRSLPKSERIARSFGSGAVGTVKSLGNALKSVGIKDTGGTVARFAEELQFKYLSTIDPTFVEQVAGGFGSAATFAIPGLGIAKGANALAFAPKLAAFLGLSASAVLESMVEGGSTYEEAVARGDNHKEAQKKAGTTFVANLPLNIVLGSWMFKNIPEGRAITEVLKSASQESLQEYFQELISTFAQGDTVLSAEAQARAVTSGAVGFLVGGGISGAQAVTDTKKDTLLTPSSEEIKPVKPEGKTLEFVPEKQKEVITDAKEEGIQATEPTELEVPKDQEVTKEEAVVKEEVDGIKKDEKRIPAKEQEGEEPVKAEPIKEPSKDIQKPKKIITDQADVQRIKNSIQEGELILKSGKTVAGRKMSKGELGAVQTSIDNSKRKIGIGVEEIKPVVSKKEISKKPEEPKAVEKIPEQTVTKKTETIKTNIDETVETDYTKASASKQAKLAEDRSSLGLDDINSPSRKSWETALGQAKKENIPSKANRIAEGVLASPRPLSDVETAGLVVRMAELKNDHKASMDDISKTKDGASIREKSAEIDRIEDEFDLLTKAVQLSGSEKGRALASQKLTINRSFDLVSVLNRAKTASGKELTKQQKEKFKKLTSELDQSNLKVETLEKEISELKASKIIRRGTSTLKNKSQTEKDADLVVLEKKINDLLKAGCEK